MKFKTIALALLSILILAAMTASPVLAQETITATVTESPTVTSTQPYTATPTLPPVKNRPIIVLSSYSVGADGAISPGEKFDLRLRVANIGKQPDGFAKDIIFAFSGTDFLPLETGGTRALNEMDPGESLEIVQPLLASTTLIGQKVATTAISVTYNDFFGNSYTENFTITINLSQPDPDCDLDYVPNTAQNHEVIYALSNSLGFGGHNSALVIKKYI